MATAKRAQIEITASTSKFGTGLRDASKKLDAFGNRARGAIADTKGIMSSVGGGISNALGFDVMSGIKSVVSDVYDMEKGLTRFQIAGKQSSEQMSAFRDELFRVSSAQGVSRAALLSGASTYYDLASDADGARENIELFAKASLASGASVDDLAKTAAALKNSLGIDSSQMQKAFDVLITQGDLGVISLKNLGEEFTAVAPAFAEFDGAKSADGVAQIGAAFQVAGKSFNGASETATGLKNLFTTLDRKAGTLSRHGVRVFDDKGNRRSFEAIRQELKTIPDKDLITVLGDSQSAAVVRALNTHSALYDDIIAKSKESNAVEANAAMQRESTAGKLAVMWETLKNKIAEAFTPERIQAFVDAMSALGEKIGWVIEKFGELKAAADAAVSDNWDESIAGFVGQFGAGPIKDMANAIKGKRQGGSTADQALNSALFGGSTASQIATGASDTTQADQFAAAKAAVQAERAAALAATKTSTMSSITVNSTLVVDGAAVAKAVANSKDPRRAP